MNKEQTLQKVFFLHAAYKDGLIPTLAQHEVNPGFDVSSRENYLYFTLPPCLNFQRSSPAMWQSALKTWEDPETRYLFSPEEVVRRPIETVGRDLSKHKLALQPNKHTAIWIAISTTLHEHFANDPRKVMEAGSFDAEKVLQLVQHDQKKLFPYLSGPKMANYWLYILSHYTDLHLANMDAISIIPDTHVMQCSVHLGIVDEKADSTKVAEAWKALLKDTDLSPVEMHPVLWNWSRNNFLPHV